MSSQTHIVRTESLHLSSYKKWYKLRGKRIMYIFNFFLIAIVVIVSGCSLSTTPEKGKVWCIPDLDMKLIYIDIEEDKNNSGDIQQHLVTISSGYWIGKYEVTQREYRFIRHYNTSHFKGDDLPVECIDWNSAMQYCKLLTERERQAGRLPAGYVYRLPSEAEWEYAAKGGIKSKRYKYSGSNSINNIAWYNLNSNNKTHNVGMKSPNELGIYDMSGNVYEWCYDLYECGSGYSEHIIRGGAFYSQASSCLLSIRSSYAKEYGYDALGFRIVLALSSTP